MELTSDGQRPPAGRPGRRRHYVPCFLSQGFAWENNRESTMWVFRKGGRKYRSNPNDWGWENDFYCGAGMDIDSGWTGSEGEDAALVEDIRVRGRLTQEDAQTIPGLLTRLALRTKNALEIGRNQARKMHEEFRKHHETDMDGEKRKAEFLRRMKNREPHFEEAARQRLKSEGIANPRPEDVEEVLECLHEEAKKLPGGLFLSTAREEAESLLVEASATERMDAIMLRSLRNEVQRGKILAKYMSKGICYGVHRVTPPNLILGDCVVVEEREGRGGRAFLPLERRDLPLKAVYLPLTPGLLLAGRIGQPEGEERPDVMWIIEEIARLSRESFIATEPSDVTERLCRKIGEATGEPTREEIEEALSVYKEEFEGSRANTTREPARRPSSVPSEETGA